MPEYIEKEKLIRDLIDNRSFYPVIVKKAIENAPTADVVPRSEVEKWKANCEQLYKEMSEQMIEERKIERKLAVSQIIGEILSRHTSDIDGFITIHVTELADLKYIGEEK